MLIEFIINATGQTVQRFFASHYYAERFMRKLKYSKKLTFVSCKKL